MSNCTTCNCVTCPDHGRDETACSYYEDDAPQFEAYVFDERSGSERIIAFRTAKARDEFIRRQPDHKMAH